MLPTISRTFLNTLRCYNDWKDYDHFIELCKSSGVSDKEIDTLISREIKDLGFSTEKE